MCMILFMAKDLEREHVFEGEGRTGSVADLYLKTCKESHCPLEREQVILNFKMGKLHLKQRRGCRSGTQSTDLLKRC